MAKFSGRKPGLNLTLRTEGDSPGTLTYEGAPAWTHEWRTELFLLGVTNMVAEDTFYEAAKTRDSRFTQLVHRGATEDPTWMQSFLPWLRTSGFMRSAPIVAAAEYVKAGGPNGRAVVNSVLQRPDEPAEILAYWTLTHGRNIPKALKRGVADAVQRLYTERNMLRYDGSGKVWRFADVIELVHPKPTDDTQSALFRYCLDRRHHGDGEAAGLPMIEERQALEATPKEGRRALLRGGDLTIPSWEWLSGWLPDGMDAEAWEAAIPQMGYMALIRNLRNFDEAGISPTAQRNVVARIANVDAVQRSKQFPFRFWSAYKNTGSLTYAAALESALDVSCGNIPALQGSTLILTDTSGSMRAPITARSSVERAEVAAVFAAALGKRITSNVDLVSWASTWTDIPFRNGQSVLKTVHSVHSAMGRDGMGTQLRPVWDAKRAWEYDRVVVFSDMQVAGRMVGAELPERTWLFNLGGYNAVPFQTNEGNVYEIGGFSDSTFRLMDLIERGRSGGWPWE